MAKICHVTSAHSRYDIRIWKKECISLMKSGHEVFLLLNDDLPNEVCENINIISTGWKAHSRIQRFLVGRNKLYIKAIDIDADVYHFHDPDLLAVALKLKKNNKKIIFDSHEDVPSVIKEKDWIPTSLQKTISGLYTLYERHALQRFDGVISVTSYITERLKKINKNTVEICNFPILDEYETLEDLIVKQENVCFTGLIENFWMHENVISAILNCAMKVKYVIAGRVTSDYLQKLTDLGGELIEYRGYLSRGETRKLQMCSKAGIALVRYPEDGNKIGTMGNTKLFEYMLAGIPVICTDFILWESIVRQYECGICVNPYDIEQISNAIEYILFHEEEAKEMGMRGQKAIIEKFNWQTQEIKLLEFYSGLI